MTLTAPEQSRPLRRSLAPGFLLEVLLCIGPALGLVRMGALNAGVKLFFLSLLALLAWHLLTVDFTRYFGLIVATIPVLMPLRKLFLFNTLLAVTLVGLMGWMILTPYVITTLRRNRPLLWLIGLTLTYWWISFVFTGVYSTNLRILDLTAVACIICLLADNRPFLSVVMTGIGMSVVLVACALAPYSERLGIAIVNNIQIGNPIEMGEGAGLIFLLAMAEDGKWLFHGGSKFWRWFIWASALVCLLLSTSRGGWLAVAIALLVLFLSVPRERGRLIVSLLGVAFMVFALIATDHGDAVVKYFDKVASSERSLSQKTTLRSDQWVTVARILDDSPVFGSGVGQGYLANVQYGGQAFVFHSLYLQIAAETGLAGLVFLFLYLGRLTIECRKHLRRSGEVMPLLATTAFLVIGLSVAGFDPLSGIYMGLALLAAPHLHNRRKVVIVRPMVPRAASLNALESAPAQASQL